MNTLSTETKPLRKEKDPPGEEWLTSTCRSAELISWKRGEQLAPEVPGIHGQREKKFPKQTGRRSGCGVIRGQGGIVQRLNRLSQLALL